MKYKSFMVGIAFISDNVHKFRTVIWLRDRCPHGANGGDGGQHSRLSITYAEHFRAYPGSNKIWAMSVSTTIMISALCPSPNCTEYCVPFPLPHYVPRSYITWYYVLLFYIPQYPYHHHHPPILLPIISPMAYFTGPIFPTQYLCFAIPMLPILWNVYTTRFLHYKNLG